jgi:hypothetical protein
MSGLEHISIVGITWDDPNSQACKASLMLDWSRLTQAFPQGRPSRFGLKANTTLRTNHAFRWFILYRYGCLGDDVSAIVPSDKQNHDCEIFEQFGEGPHEVPRSVCPLQLGHSLSGHPVPSAPPNDNNIRPAFFWNGVFDLFALSDPSGNFVVGGHAIRILVEALDRAPNEVRVEAVVMQTYIQKTIF